MIRYNEINTQIMHESGIKANSRKIGVCEEIAFDSMKLFIHI